MGLNSLTRNTQLSHLTRAFWRKGHEIIEKAKQTLFNGSQWVVGSGEILWQVLKATLLKKVKLKSKKYYIFQKKRNETEG